MGITGHRFEAGGRSWLALYDVNALVEIEEGLGIRIDQLGEVLAAPPLGTLRLVLWCGLMREHPELTQEDVGAMVPAGEMAGIVGAALAASFPAAEAGGRAPAGPRKRRAGTGTPS